MIEYQDKQVLMLIMMDDDTRTDFNMEGPYAQSSHENIEEIFREKSLYMTDSIDFSASWSFSLSNSSSSPKSALSVYGKDSSYEDGFNIKRRRLVEKPPSEIMTRCCTLNNEMLSTTDEVRFVGRVVSDLSNTVEQVTAHYWSNAVYCEVDRDDKDASTLHLPSIGKHEYLKKNACRSNNTHLSAGSSSTSAMMNTTINSAHHQEPKLLAKDISFLTPTRRKVSISYTDGSSTGKRRSVRHKKSLCDESASACSYVTYYSNHSNLQPILKASPVVEDRIYGTSNAVSGNYLSSTPSLLPNQHIRKGSKKRRESKQILWNDDAIPELITGFVILDSYGGNEKCEGKGSKCNKASHEVGDGCKLQSSKVTKNQSNPPILDFVIDFVIVIFFSYMVIVLCEHMGKAS